jgi:hypothetical protein
VNDDNARAVEVVKRRTALTPAVAVGSRPEIGADSSGWRGRCGCLLVRLRLHRRPDARGTTAAGEPIIVAGGVELVLGADRSLYRLVDCAICRTKVVSGSRPLRRPSDLHRPPVGVICASCCARATTNHLRDARQ